MSISDRVVHSFGDFDNLKVALVVKGGKSVSGKKKKENSE